MNQFARKSLAAAATALIATAGAHATIVLGNGDSVNLAALLADGSDRKFIVNDKMFTVESWGSSQFHADDFQVVGFVSLNPNEFGLYNVGFDLTGPFGDGSPGDGHVHEMNLQYTVEVLPEWYDRGVRLCDARLLFNGSAGGSGSFSRVDETILDLDANQFLGELSVFETVNATTTTRHVDGLDFCDLYQTSGYRAFEVNKDLKFFAAHEGDFATASFVRQEFSQVPAPGAIGLLAASGMLALRRRRA